MQASNRRGNRGARQAALLAYGAHVERETGGGAAVGSDTLRALHAAAVARALAEFREERAVAGVNDDEEAALLQVYTNTCDIPTHARNRFADSIIASLKGRYKTFSYFFSVFSYTWNSVPPGIVSPFFFHRRYAIKEGAFNERVHAIGSLAFLLL